MNSDNSFEDDSVNAKMYQTVSSLVLGNEDDDDKKIKFIENYSDELMTVARDILTEHRNPSKTRKWKTFKQMDFLKDHEISVLNPAHNSMIVIKRRDNQGRHVTLKIERPCIVLKTRTGTKVHDFAEKKMYTRLHLDPRFNVNKRYGFGNIRN
jgi:hypothetical protein